jgi:hypothetical protein
MVPPKPDNIGTLRRRWSGQVEGVLGMVMGESGR